MRNNMPLTTKKTNNPTVMSFAYFPHTDSDIQEMLQRIGVNSLDDLYADVPEMLSTKMNMTFPTPCRNRKSAGCSANSTARTAS